MFANANLAEGSLSQLATNSIPFKNLFLIHELKFLKIVNVQSPFLFRTIRVYWLLLDKILANVWYLIVLGRVLKGWPHRLRRLMKRLISLLSLFVSWRYVSASLFLFCQWSSTIWLSGWKHTCTRIPLQHVFTLSHYLLFLNGRWRLWKSKLLISIILPPFVWKLNWFTLPHHGLIIHCFALLLVIELLLLHQHLIATIIDVVRHPVVTWRGRSWTAKCARAPCVIHFGTTGTVAKIWIFLLWVRCIRCVGSVRSILII